MAQTGPQTPGERALSDTQTPQPPGRTGRRRLGLARAALLASAALLCWGGATLAANEIEKRSEQGVTSALRLAGHDWVSVATDGLQVQLSGTAPSEAQRVKAITVAGGAVDSDRLVDLMEVASSTAVTAPVFSIEVLRNDGGIQLIGLIPASTDRAALIEQIKETVANGQVIDLLETADYQAPDTWDRAVAYAVASLRGLPRAKVTIRADQVSITAITESATEKAQIETDLTRRKPEAITLLTDISAPRPVIAPFTLRFVIDDQGARFDACSADSDLARDRILQAAVAAGVKGTPGCTIGLGAPNADWGTAVAQAIAALAGLGHGSVTVADGDVSLIAAEGVAQEAFDRAVGSLESNLPQGYSLQAERLVAEPVTQSGPKQFTAELTDDGGIALTGAVVDDRQRNAIEAYARARFGSDKVQLALRTADDVPQGWAVKVIAALEVLGALKDGDVRVEPDLVSVNGVSGDPTVSDTVARVLSDRLGAGAHYALQIRYDRRLDPALGLPTGDDCVDRLNTALAKDELAFAPNKADLEEASLATVRTLTGLMADCTDFRMEIGGHTDSQGSEGFNQSLSENRAKAVLAALSGAGVVTANMTARGYGESQPVASNESEAGRDTNRRIEFRLLSPEPVSPNAAPDAVPVVSGTTVEAPPEPIVAAPPIDQAPVVGAAPAPGAALPEGPPAAIRAVPGTTAAEPGTETANETAPEAANKAANEAAADSFTLDGYTVRIEPAGADTPRPSARPDRDN